MYKHQVMVLQGNYVSEYLWATISVKNAIFPPWFVILTMSAFSHVSSPVHITLGAALLWFRELQIQFNRLRFSLDRERDQKVLPPQTKPVEIKA